MEVLVEGVTESLERPTRLILAVPDPEAGLVVAGGTSTLSDAHAAEVAAFLHPPSRPHPWPTVIPLGRSGVWVGEPLEITLVDPTLVVEVLADTTHERGHWRHVVRYIRVRPELHPDELLAPGGNGGLVDMATSSREGRASGPATTSAG